MPVEPYATASNDRSIVVFDGNCVLCSANAQFILRHDRRGVFLLTTMQSEAGNGLYRRFGIDPANYFHLFTFLVILFGVITGPFVILIGLALFLPTLAVNVRRLHDINKSGWYIFIACVPLIGPIILLIWHCERGTYGDNRFGPDPLQNWI